MKAYKLFILAIAGATLSGCQDFLSNNSPSAMGSEYVFSSPERCEQAIAGVYELFGSNNGYRNRLACGFQGLNTDIEHHSYSTSDKAEQKAIALYSMTPSNSQVSSATNADIWSYLNVGIERCNNIIEGIEENGQRDENNNLEAKTQYYKGEAHFLRAFQYLEMVKYWGDVPLRYKSLGADLNGASVPKTDRNDIYEFIRQDLKEAAKLLPWSAECPGRAANTVERPSKAAALALLARADLMYAGYSVRPESLEEHGNSGQCSIRLNVEDAAKRQELYQEALEACAQVINNEDSKLLADYESVFRLICADETNYTKMEHIWVMPFNAGSRGQFLNYNCPKLTGTGQKDELEGHLPNFKASCSTSSVQSVSPLLIYEFEKGDKRKYTTFVPGVWRYNDGSDSFSDPDKREVYFGGLGADTKRLFEKVSKIDKFYLGKYRVEWMSHDHSGTDDGVDFPILRYADVLLMFAEASIGGISGDAPVNNTKLDGKAQLDKVRKRAGLDPAVALNMDAIMHERACELCGEYIRKWDLMRWNKFVDNMKNGRATLDKMTSKEGRTEMQINDTIYFQYKFDADINGYVINRETVWGLNKGEMGLPADYDETYIKSGLFISDNDEVLGNAKYPMYENESYLTTHQYWPIFSVNVGISNGTLWNDYGYGE